MPLRQNLVRARSAARARARENPFFSIMVNVGQMMVWVIGANLHFEIFHFFTVCAADLVPQHHAAPD